jgi:putative ABC transport system substrate-binding protein
MRRRELISLLGAAAAWPLAARAQQPALPVVGFLSGGSSDAYASRVAAFRTGLSEAGFVEGRNVAIEYRWAEGQYDRLPALVADLVDRKVVVIVASTGIDARTAKAATTSIPIVFMSAGSPIESGLIASLNRPGGNLTGVTNLNVELGPKRLELLHELLPMAPIFAVLVNPTNANAEAISRDAQAAAGRLGLELRVVRASTERELEAAFGSLAQLRVSGVVISNDPFFNTRRDELAALSVRNSVPVISQSREFTAAGVLMSYGGNLPDAYHLMGIYTGRILKGEKPADLPVQQATKVELIINLKTAKALGLAVPLTLLARADEVIE